MSRIFEIVNKFPKSWRVPAIVLAIVTVFNVPFQKDPQTKQKEKEMISNALQQIWVDSLYQSMTPKEKIGQLMMVRGYSNKGPEHTKELLKHVEQHHIGGVIFFQGEPIVQAKVTNELQDSAKIPLMVAMDAEWGLGMRLKEHTISFPKQLTLGAIKNNKLIYDMGKEVARQCRRLGVHVNFAPVVDINNNPDNPVINTRSFGEDRYNVTAKSYMYARGMQDHGVMACAKHFPGHGDTNVDSHYDLPVIKHDYQRLDSIEFYPFKMLAQNGIQSMMMGHLSIPVLDLVKNRPSSLAPSIVTGLLQKKFGYSGLIFTDGLGMQGVAKYFKNGQAEVQALKAGNDVLILPESVPNAISAIQKALKTGELEQENINRKVKKILRSKHRLGLDTIAPIQLDSLVEDLNTLEAKLLNDKLIEKAMTVVRNKDGLLPFYRLDTLDFAAVSIGAKGIPTFQTHLEKYSKVKLVNFGKTIPNANGNINILKKNKVVFVSFHDMNNKASTGYGTTKVARDFVNKLSKETTVVLVLMGTPYALKYFDDIEHVLVSYNDDKTSQRKAAQAVFGAIGTNGILPVSASAKSKFGDGVATANLKRLMYTPPIFAGMDPIKLAEVDRIMNKALKIKATPGGQIMVVKDRNVVYQKSFGYHTYLPKSKVKQSDIYDLASVTKIAATTLSVMKLQEEGKIDIEKPIGNYFSKAKGTNKGTMTIKSIMAHQSGMKDWIPFYEETITKKYKRPKKSIYSTVKKDPFSVQVANNLFIDAGYRDTIWNRIIRSDLRKNTNYRYSDLGFYILKRVVEVQAGKPMEKYVQEQFYQPLGLQTLTYLPLEKFPKSRIIPSERDAYFRHQILTGHVHDMGAAMMGGICGHAGLFGNANDLAIFMQMLLNEGEYGGKQFLKPETIQKFTKRYSKKYRRAIGFDMKELDTSKDPNIAVKSSKGTFGHTGFTGVGVWADPEEDLIFIFISNRTYPTMRNWKLNKEDVRLNIHDAIYESIMPKDSTQQSDKLLSGL